ncbi:ABC transporter ATP-binding protein [Qaidamihabitans albus]|uniref:ABC transporter ATP-binding protein n=1 Tax=Qaidamihabitans albus TaxID=2795733 RepID=UPI0018F20D1F|nr:ABC transporter ATP-binding protein [Qaidamihabitans albus]
MDDAIFVSGLRKSFGRTVALDGLDLSVATGEVHGFLGPTGSGKSTTARILLGLLHADEGTVRLLGGDPWRDAAKLHRRLAYVPGNVDLWPDLSGGEVIDLLGRLRGGLDQRRRKELVERFDLDPTRKCRDYSKGDRQKVAVVTALSSPSSHIDLLILDEPTTGLNPLMEATFQYALHEEREQGRTILLASHVLAEVESLCDRVSIVSGGRAVESGTLDELRHLTRTSISAELAGPRPWPDGLSEPHVHNLRVDGNHVRFDVETNGLDQVLRQLSEVGVRSLTSQPLTLEELFPRHHTYHARSKAAAAK